MTKRERKQDERTLQSPLCLSTLFTNGGESLLHLCVSAPSIDNLTCNDLLDYFLNDLHQYLCLFYVISWGLITFASPVPPSLSLSLVLTGKGDRCCGHLFTPGGERGYFSLFSLSHLSLPLSPSLPLPFTSASLSPPIYIYLSSSFSTFLNLSLFICLYLSLSILIFPSLSLSLFPPFFTSLSPLQPLFLLSLYLATLTCLILPLYLSLFLSPPSCVHPLPPSFPASVRVLLLHHRTHTRDRIRYYLYSSRDTCLPFYDEPVQYPFLVKSDRIIYILA